jgi:phage terminase large subunit-like protein
MTTGALAERAAGSEVGERRGAKDQRVDRSLPPWRSWRTRSRAARAIRFIETYCRVPSGVGAGELIRLHRYQRHSLEVLLAEGVRTGGEQIPRGNAKSTLWAAVGLWALCDHPDSPQVPLVAFNSLQAQRTLMRPVRSMVRACPELEARVAVYTATNDRRAWSAWNDGELLPLPASAERLQGLNPTVALIDEAQTLPPAVLSAVLQGAGKRAASLVLAIGTPAPGAQDSALFNLRGQAGSVAWVEYAAPAGCALDDRAAWAAANPALRAGLLHADVLESELALVTEAEFRCYRLGQWVDAVVADWLPSGAWEACPQVEAPGEGVEVVLALAGTWTSSVAVVGATLDGAVFVAWAAETATDDELASVLAAAFERWRVAEVVVAPRCRGNLVARLGDDRAPVEVWPSRVDVEVTSATEWRRAIVEGRVPHDHHPLLAEHVAASVARSTSDGSLRLVAPDDGRSVDAARAARMAWSRAVDLADRFGGGAPVIY